MVNLGQKKLNEDLLLSVKIIKCRICNKEFEPTKNDISTKNPNVYYKACTPCREKKMEYYQKRERKKYVKIFR